MHGKLKGRIAHWVAVKLHLTEATRNTKLVLDEEAVPELTLQLPVLI